MVTTINESVARVHIRSDLPDAIVDNSCPSPSFQLYRGVPSRAEVLQNVQGVTDRIDRLAADGGYNIAIAQPHPAEN